MNTLDIGTQFTVFLPVKNGGSYLPLCVESILSQNYQNFELVILENQSADGTAGWLQSLASRDSRVKVIPSEPPLSIEDNWKRILQVSKNEFMTIIGHDDLLEPDFLDEINALIQEEPKANLYLTHFKLIDGEGKLIRYCKPIPKQETAAEFLAARMAGIRDSFGTGYVMRSADYDRHGGIQPYTNLLYADDALWLRLMHDSYKVTSSRACFSYRLHAGSVSGTQNFEALLSGLKQYLSLLTNLATTDKELAAVVERYVPNHVGSVIQAHFNHHVRTTCWMTPLNNLNWPELQLVLKDFAPEFTLDRSATKLSNRLAWKFYAWIRNRCT